MYIVDWLLPLLPERKQRALCQEFAMANALLRDSRQQAHAANRPTAAIGKINPQER